MTTDKTPCTRCGTPTTFVSGLCAPCAQRRAQHLDELRLFGPRPSRRMKSHPHPPNREDLTMTVDLPGARRYPGPTLTLCRDCQVAAGFWPASDPLCPSCAAVAREAGE